MSGEDGELTGDVLFRTSDCDDRSIPVHSVTMSTCSPYFRALLTTEAKPRHEYVIPGVSFETLDEIVRFGHSRTVTLTNDNAVELMIAADQFNIERLIGMCEEYLVSKLEPMNCIGLEKFGRSYFSRCLETTSHSFLLRNFVEVADFGDEFLDLEMEDLVGILEDDRLNVRNEEEVWEAALRWIERDEENRKEHVLRLLGTIRVGLLDTRYIIENVWNDRRVRGRAECRSIVARALQFANGLELQPNERDEASKIARPRLPYEILLAIGGWSAGSPTNAIEAYDVKGDGWISIKAIDPMGQRLYHGCEVVGDEIYVIGGYDGHDHLRECRSFNFVTRVWRDVRSMETKRCYVNTTVLNGMIYAMGGFDGVLRHRTAERYCLNTNQWSQIPSMNKRRSDASAASLQGRIYIVGGFNGTDYLRSVECYEPGSPVWTSIKHMCNIRSGVSCVAYHGSLYALGGNNGEEHNQNSRQKSAERYDLATERWTPIADMYTNRSNFAAKVLDDKIYVVGGFGGTNVMTAAECYDDKSNEWSHVADMNIPRSALGACVIPLKENVLDYVLEDRKQLVENLRKRRRQTNCKI